MTIAVCPYGLKNYENLGYRLTGSLAGSRPLRWIVSVGSLFVVEFLLNR